MKQAFSAAIGLLAAIASMAAAPPKASVPNADADAHVSKIVDATIRACGTVPTESFKSGDGIGAAGNVGAKGLLKGFVDADVSANVKYQRQQTSGFAQESLATAFAARENCVSKALTSLAHGYDIRVISTGKPIDSRKIAAAAIRAKGRSTTTRPSASAQDGSAVVNNSGNGNSISTQASNSNGQAGCSGAGCQSIGVQNIVPVTPDQKEIAVRALTIKLKELKRFIAIPAQQAPPTLAERHLTSPIAFRLNVTLGESYADSIQGLPNGPAMLKFQTDYTSYQLAEAIFERDALPKIGALEAGKPLYEWSNTLDYAIYRTMGSDPQKVKGEGYYASVGLDPDYAEKVYQNLMADKAFGPVLQKSVKMLFGLQEGSLNLLQPY